MDTALNEIQTLRRELGTFRNENIALYNELTKQNKTLCEELINLRNQVFTSARELAQHHAILNQEIKNYGGGYMYDDLKKYLNRMAAMQTVEFIAENMLKLKSFDSRDEYLQYLLEQVDYSKDLFLEFGVFEGRSINLISATKPEKIIYGFDSFEGLPETWWQETNYPKGKFSLQGNLPKVNRNVRLIKGWFDETLPAFVKTHPEPCAFIHIDCDLYSSAKTVLNTLKNQIGMGTIIAFDEYFNYPGWQDNEYKVFEEFVAENNINFEYIARTNSTQVAVKIK